MSWKFVTPSSGSYTLCDNHTSNSWCFCGAGEHPSFYEKRKIGEPHVLCSASGGIILKASQLHDHLVHNNELLVVIVHEIGGGSKVKTEDINSQKFELVIVDEAHHCLAHMWKAVVDHFREPCVCVIQPLQHQQSFPTQYLNHVTSWAEEVQLN